MNIDKKHEPIEFFYFALARGLVENWLHLTDEDVHLLEHLSNLYGNANISGRTDLETCDPGMKLLSAVHKTES